MKKQLVIEMDEDIYEACKDEVMWQCCYSLDLHDALVNAIPLPKGHGRLIDADALEGQPMITPHGNGQYEEVTVYYQNDIDVATTIIEADRR